MELDLLKFETAQQVYEIWAHVLSGASLLILVLAGLQNRLRTIEEWFKERYPDSPYLPKLVRFEYHLDSANDLLEKLVTSFRSTIAPRRKQERASDREQARVAAGGTR